MSAHLGGELAACPFCASDMVRVEEGLTQRYFVGHCQSCGATGPEIKSQQSCPPNDEVAKFKQQAIAAWNRRAHPREPERVEQGEP